MNSKYFLEDEQLITQPDGGLITLTNLRIRYSNTKGGSGHIVSIMLEKISSIEVHYHSKGIFMILALIALFGACISVVQGEGELIVIALGIAVLLFVLFLASRKHVLTISSAGGAKIYFKTQGIKREKVLSFINHIEKSVKDRQEDLKS